MKRFLAVTLLSIPTVTLAQSQIITEVLIGQSTHKVNNNSSATSTSKYKASLDDTSLAFRIGYKFTDNFTAEAALHDHGEVTNKFEVRVPTPIPGSPDESSCCLGPEHDTVFNATIPLDLQSVRLGIKGQWPVQEKLSVNARLGIASWEFSDYSPAVIGEFSTNSNQSGNDIYFGFGADYQITDNIHLGFEYSQLAIDESFQNGNGISGSYQYDVNDISLILGWTF